MLTLRGRNEEKVALCADYVRKELDKTLPALGEFIIAGPAPAPLLKAENYFRYQIMVRGKQMSKLSRSLATLNETVKMPEDITLITDIDPVNMV
jgi:primosomal protein N'